MPTVNNRNDVLNKKIVEELKLLGQYSSSLVGFFKGLKVADKIKSFEIMSVSRNTGSPFGESNTICKWNINGIWYLYDFETDIFEEI